ncbi:MAG TPA: response regulator transcription factor [Bryobacteraceae bacterium]|jgi:DNA-binding NarL/FixJ family response regulator|nr:response regulator transcription factor [Bryobacteraceae bacterium]
METQTSGNRIRLLLLDDHVLFRESLSRLLASEPDFEIAAGVGTAAEALDVLRREPIDIVLLDFDLGEDHGNRFISEARAAGFAGRVLMVTAGMNASESSIALQMGASGIFLKHNSPATLAKAIRQVAQGEMWVDPRIIQMMADGVRQPAGPGFEKLLTDRERQVLQAIFEGMTNKEIAAQLGVSEGAIKATLQQLFQKTRVRTRSQLVRIALETSLATVRKP